MKRLRAKIMQRWNHEKKACGFLARRQLATLARFHDLFLILNVQNEKLDAEKAAFMAGEEKGLFNLK